MWSPVCRAAPSPGADLILIECHEQVVAVAVAVAVAVVVLALGKRKSGHR